MGYVWVGEKITHHKSFLNGKVEFYAWTERKLTLLDVIKKRPSNPQADASSHNSQTQFDIGREKNPII
jgi:hypothetical protein